MLNRIRESELLQKNVINFGEHSTYYEALYMRWFDKNKNMSAYLILHSNMFDIIYTEILQ
jgi:hypothetical protein